MSATCLWHIITRVLVREMFSEAVRYASASPCYTIQNRPPSYVVTSKQTNTPVIKVLSIQKFCDCTENVSRNMQILTTRWLCSSWWRIRTAQRTRYWPHECFHAPCRRTAICSAVAGGCTWSCNQSRNQNTAFNIIAHKMAAIGTGCAQNSIYLLLLKGRCLVTAGCCDSTILASREFATVC